MKYLTTNFTNLDTHIIYTKNYVIEVEFYPVKYWTLAAKYCSTKYSIYLYLPTCNIFINSNKD